MTQPVERLRGLVVFFQPAQAEQADRLEGAEPGGRRPRAGPPEIADGLHVSLRTVEADVRDLKSVLGVRSRAQHAAWATHA